MGSYVNMLMLTLSNIKLDYLMLKSQVMLVRSPYL